MNFWTGLIWIGNTLYPRWFVAVVVIAILVAVTASGYGIGKLLQR